MTKIAYMEICSYIKNGLNISMGIFLQNNSYLIILRSLIYWLNDRIVLEIITIHRRQNVGNKI